jgi:hypothetical protein
MDFPIKTGSVQNPYREFTYAIPVSGQIPIYFAHNFFSVLSISAGASIAARFGAGGGETTIISAGIGLELPEVLPSVTLINKGAGIATVTVGMAIGRISDNRFSATTTLATSDVKAANLRGTADIALVAAAAAVTLLAADTTRRTAIITNTSLANSARVSNAPGAAIGGYLAPGASISLDGTYEIKGYSAAGATLALLEVLD